MTRPKARLVVENGAVPTEAVVYLTGPEAALLALCCDYYPNLISEGGAWCPLPFDDDRVPIAEHLSNVLWRIARKLGQP